MAQQSNPNLSVSAESSAFNNYFSGAQVSRSSIIDPDIDETNEAKGEPDVTVNSNKLRMVQATDGKWYGYIADIDHALVADATVTTETRPDKTGAAVNATAADINRAGLGLDFGTICTPAQAEGVFQEALGNRNVDYFSDAIAVAFPFYKAEHDVSATPPTVTPQATSCAEGAHITDAFADPPSTGTGNAGTTALNVVREAKAINDGQKFGQSIEDGGATSLTRTPPSSGPSYSSTTSTPRATSSSSTTAAAARSPSRSTTTRSTTMPSSRWTARRTRAAPRCTSR